MYLLLDANVVAAYYLPRSIRSKNARSRIANIIASVRTGASSHFLYIPNFCIAEVFSVFAKHSWGRWNTHLKNKGTIDTRVYNSLIRQFRTDIHNGAFFYQYELSRYHILGIDLVAPLDHYYQITRAKRVKKGKPHVPAGTFDHLIISMGVQLAHIHGEDNVAVVTADTRLAKILQKCGSGIPAKTVKKLKLDRAEAVTGRPFSADIFPKCADLVTAQKGDLEDVFGEWPLPVTGKDDAYRWPKV